MAAMAATGTSRRAGAALLERDRELATVDALIAAATAGEAALAVVEGRAGIGKSRLLQAARDRAEAAGLRTLSARGTELEREFPFGAVRQLFEPLAADPELWERALGGAAAAARPVFEAPVAAGGDDASDVSFAALHGLYWLTANLAAESPLLLAVDDLHWCDRPSLRFLAYLAPRLEGLPVLVVAGLRTAEPGTDPALLADLMSAPSTAIVAPGPLSRDAVRGLVVERLGEDADEAFVAACAEATGGNPLLLGQLITSLASEAVRPAADQAAMVRAIGPRAVSRTILLRLARLDRAAVDTAHALAVLGDGAELPAVAALAGLDEPATAAATRTLARADILRPDAPLGFAHPLIREAVYRDLGPAERELMHARAAELLTEAGAGDDKIATQLLQAPRRGERWVVDVLRRAARSALARGAADSAAAYLSRALEEPPPPDLRADLLSELADAEERTSGVAALGHLREAYAEIEDPRRRARLAFRIAFLLLFTGSPEEARPVLEGAKAEAAEGSDDWLMLEALDVMLAYFAIGDIDALDRLVPYRRPRQGPGPGALMVSVNAAFAWALVGGDKDTCVDLALQAVPYGEVPLDSGVVPAAVGVILTAAERPEVEEHWSEREQAANRAGSLFGALTVHVWRAWGLLGEGQLDEAAADMIRGQEAQNLWGSLVAAGTGQAAGVMASILVEKGQLEQARAVLDPEPIEHGASFGGVFRVAAEVELLLAERRHEEALVLAQEHFDASRRWIDNPGVVHWRSYIAQALDALGRSDEALPVIEEELERARRWGAPGPVGRALRVRGVIRRAEGIDDLREAADLLSGSTRRLEHAKALAALGGGLRRARQPSDAREPLRRALELATACGAEALAAEARQELAAAGVRPRTTALGGIESLTASEKRVSALAAAGHTNRDIAQELYVTPKTVEVHLSNAYRKLGIRSRRELAGALEAA